MTDSWAKRLGPRREALSPLKLRRSQAPCPGNWRREEIYEDDGHFGWITKEEIMPATVTILEVVSDNRFILKCSLCGGSGNKPGYRSYVACEICTGKGVVLVEGEPPFVPCRLCSGSGNKPGYKSYVPCDACQGVGAQPIQGRMKLLQ